MVIVRISALNVKIMELTVAYMLSGISLVLMERLVLFGRKQSLFGGISAPGHEWSITICIIGKVDDGKVTSVLKVSYYADKGTVID